MAKNKNLKRKAAPVVKKAHNEWLDETIEPSDDDEVCIYLPLFSVTLRACVLRLRHAIQAFQFDNFVYFCSRFLRRKLL